jgi:preprotein translocase subunit YajC
MIKVVNLVALLAAPLVVTFAEQPDTRTGVTIVMLVLLAVIVWAILRSKREDTESQQMVEAVAKAK